MFGVYIKTSDQGGFMEPITDAVKQFQMDKEQDIQAGKEFHRAFCFSQLQYK